MISVCTFFGSGGSSSSFKLEATVEYKMTNNIVYGDDVPLFNVLGLDFDISNQVTPTIWFNGDAVSSSISFYTPSE